jgi:hypothetical protein
MNIPIVTTLKEAKVDREACLVEGIILSPGLSENGTYYPPEVVEESAPIFRGVQCFADHPRPGETERSVRDVVGAIEDAWPDNGSIRGTMRISRTHDWLVTMLAEGLAGDISINALGRTKVARRDGRVVREVIAITKAFSVDFVAKAAAGGRVERILRESEGYAEGLRLLERLSPDELSEARPDLVDTLRERVREELLSEREDGKSEIGRLEDEIERRRIALGRELVAVQLIDRCGLPAKAREFLLSEALSMKVESEDLYEPAVSGLIERHREYLASLSADGHIKGMGSSKDAGSGMTGVHRETLRLMGVLE